MIDDEELATAPDYRWRRLWNQFWIPSCVVVFLIVAIASGDLFFLPAIVTAIFYYLVGKKVVELDAAERGSGPAFSDTVAASLERQRGERTDTPSTPSEDLPSGLPVTGRTEQDPSPARRPTATSFGRANPPSKKPVDLPRHRS